MGEKSKGIGENDYANENDVSGVFSTTELVNEILYYEATSLKQQCAKLQNKYPQNINLPPL